MTFPGGAIGKESTCQSMRCKRQEFNSLSQEDPLEKEMATHSSILDWKIPWTEEPGGLQSMRLQRVGHGTQQVNNNNYVFMFLCHQVLG